MDCQVEYWLKESLENVDTAKILFEHKKYIEAAFFCHLAFEKMLKAFFVKRNKAIPPKSHNLLLLAKRSHLMDEIGESRLDFLADLNLFQIEGRYPGDREVFYMQTTVEKFAGMLNRTEAELKWLEQKLKSEK